MSLGILKVGSLTLNENYLISDATNASSGERTVQLSGIETFPGRTLAEVRAIADDITSMFGKTVPVTFSHKVDRNGYYAIEDVNVSNVNWDGEAASVAWGLGLTRIGPDNAVDIESRITHVVRANSFSLVGERWHAPSIGHAMYYIGAVAPSSVTRTGADGAIVVYRAIPVVNPRWSCPVASFQSGRARFLSGGIERTGAGILLPTTGWEFNNGLVRVKPGTSGVTSLLVAAYTGGAWREKAWDVRIAGDTLVPGTHFMGVTLLRNDPEMVSVRILAIQPSSGQRVILDLSLRRGSRIVEGYVQRSTSGDLMVCLDALETFTDSSASGYVVASANDANGNMSVAGSAKTFTAAANGGVFLTPATAMDFWLGYVVGGTGAVVGDQAINLRDQYIASALEATMVVAR